MKHKIICIDAGHGGHDSGAVHGKLVEKSLNLTVALALGKALMTAGWNVIYTRKADVFIEINDRVKIAQKAKATLFVSIHHNAGGGVGGEFIYEHETPESERLATEVMKAFKAVGQKAHGVGAYSKEDSKGDNYFGVLRNGSIIGGIGEYAFIDSNADGAKLTPVGLEKEVEAYFNALQAFNK